MRRKEERSKQGQTNNKAKQHSTPNVYVNERCRRKKERSKQDQTNNKAMYIYIHVHVHVECSLYNAPCIILNMYTCT